MKKNKVSKFKPVAGCHCRAFMKEIDQQVNMWRKRLGLRPVALGTFYAIRRRAAQAWLDIRTAQYPKDPAKWTGNPFLAVGRNGGYVFSKKNANHILAVAVAYDLKQPRGLPAVKAARAKKRLAVFA